MMLKKYLDGNQNVFTSSYLEKVIGLIIAGVLLYLLQKRLLKLKVLTTAVDHKTLTNYLHLLCKEWDWTPYFVADNVFIAKTRRSFFSGSWGEQVTILMNGKEILVNSICDPDKRASVVSFGHNQENVQAVKKLIENLNRLQHTG